MSRLKDDNVVRLLGICTTGTPFIMMEYMENGDLNNYLQQFGFTTKIENPPTENKIRLDALVYMSYQIASGMNYFSSFCVSLSIVTWLLGTFWLGLTTL